jgi:hypothetical protein
MIDHLFARCIVAMTMHERGGRLTRKQREALRRDLLEYLSKANDDKEIRLITRCLEKFNAFMMCRERATPERIKLISDMSNF